MRGSYGGKKGFPVETAVSADCSGPKGGGARTRFEKIGETEVWSTSTTGLRLDDGLQKASRQATGNRLSENAAWR